MHRNVMKSAHFGPYKESYAAIFEDIYLKFGTHAYRYAFYYLYSGFLESSIIFENTAQNPKFLVELSKILDFSQF